MGEVASIKGGRSGKCRVCGKPILLNDDRTQWKHSYPLPPDPHLAVKR